MLLSASQAAEYLGVHLNTVKKKIRQGKVEAFQTPGGHWRLDTDDLDAYLERGPAVVTRAGAAELLGVSPQRVDQLARAGRLPFFERDGARWFRRDQLLVIANARAARAGL